MHNPELTLMIYRSMLVKQTRFDPISYRQTRRVSVERVRVITAHALMAAAARIAPVPHTRETLPSIGEVSVATGTPNA